MSRADPLALLRSQEFAFDEGRGTISDQRVLATVPEDVGALDGMTVDAAGDLWVAVYGGGQVRRLRRRL